ncbi:sulfatase-like hydrolase/transferase, partial [Vibrio fluvialis]
LPSTYASSVRVQGNAPLLIDVMKKNDYQFGLFSGNNFADPLYKETMFRSLPIEAIAVTNDESSPDEQAVQRWAEWLNVGQKQPWFSYLELTTVEEFSELSSAQESAEDRLRSAYNLSVTQADQVINTVLEQLNSLKLMDNTVVVITSNHGTEFNETKTNTWGSNTNYSRYQLQVPMVIHWPGKVAGTYAHRSS